MAMDDKKKTGIGFLISAGLFAVAGVVFLQNSATPDWLETVFMVASAIGNAIGLVFVVPKTKPVV